MEKQTEQRNRQVVLYGQATLQNSVLAGHIQQQLKIACSFQAKLELPVALAKPNNKITKQLFLIEAELIQREMFSELLEQIHRLNTEAAIAFYNVTKLNLIEQLVSWPLVNGMFYHDVEQQQFYRGIQAMLNGEHWLPRCLLMAYLQHNRKLPQGITPWRAQLTPREKEILLLTTTGASNQEIAQDLGLSKHTIKTHMHNIFKKIGVDNRVQAINWATDYLGRVSRPA